MQDERNFGTTGGSTGGTGSGLSSTGSGLSGSTGSTTSGLGTPGTGTAEANRLGSVDQLQDRADALMDQAAERLEGVAGKIDSVAGRIPRKGIGEQANSYGHTAADTLETVARWLRDNDTATLSRELGGLVANRPMSMLLLAVGAGFVAGKVLR